MSLSALELRTGRTKSTELVGRHCLGAPAGESAARRDWHNRMESFKTALQGLPCLVVCLIFDKTLCSFYCAYLFQSVEWHMHRACSIPTLLSSLIMYHLLNKKFMTIHMSQRNISASFIVKFSEVLVLP